MIEVDKENAEKTFVHDEKTLWSLRQFGKFTNPNKR